jgi:hypothetical protein
VAPFPLPEEGDLSWRGYNLEALCFLLPENCTFSGVPVYGIALRIYYPGLFYSQISSEIPENRNHVMFFFFFYINLIAHTGYSI